MSVAGVTVQSCIDIVTAREKAKRISRSVNAPFFAEFPRNCNGLFLVVGEKGLELVFCESNRKPALLVHVDFVHGKNRFRLATNFTTRQPLARAVGIRPGVRPRLFDATAGLGGDAFVLASLGCEVTMCERNPVVFELLMDGMQRGLTDEKIAGILTDNMRLIHGDGVEILQKRQGEFDTVYLDPMYPHSSKSALNKQTMRVLRRLVGDDEDGSLLLAAAMASAKKRVVVKRPANAPHLGDIQPSHMTAMKNSRFDIYLSGAV